MNEKITISPEAVDAKQIWDILVECADASEDERLMFYHLWPCREFRFVGSLGFGGKVRQRRDGDGTFTQVDCYPEDRNAERDKIVRVTNERLAMAGL